MTSGANAREDHAAEVTLAIRPRAPWQLATVEALPGFRLRVRFNDGTEGIVALAGLIDSPGAGVFAALRDESVFRQVRVVLGAATWPRDLDLAPDAMYRAVGEHGTWIMT